MRLPFRSPKCESCETTRSRSSTPCHELRTRRSWLAARLWSRSFSPLDDVVVSAMLGGLLRHGLHHRHQVFCAVIHLVHQQLLVLFAAFARRDVDDRAGDAGDEPRRGSRGPRASPRSSTQVKEPSGRTIRNSSSYGPRRRWMALICASIISRSGGWIVLIVSASATGLVPLRPVSRHRPGDQLISPVRTLKSWKPRPAASLAIRRRCSLSDRACSASLRSVMSVMVPKQPHRAAGFVVVRLRLIGHPADAAVLVDHPVLTGIELMFLHGLRNGLLDASGIFRVKRLEIGGRVVVALAKPENGQHLPLTHHVPGHQIPVPHAGAAGSQRQFKTLLAIAQRSLSLLAGGDVGRDADPARQNAVRILLGNAAHQEPAPHAVMAAEAVLRLEGNAACRTPRPDFGRGAEVVRIDEVQPGMAEKAGGGRPARAQKLLFT